MAMDGITLYGMLRELSPLAGSRIDKAAQPDADTLLLSLHGGGVKRARLLINIHHENGRIQLTQKAAENPNTAPAFLMLLRKHLTGARVEGFSQVARDRVAHLSLTGRNALQDEVPLTLVIELTGRHGNLFLLDGDGMILDCMRHIGPDENGLRLCLPHVRYTPLPMQDKRDPLTLTLADAAQIVAAAAPAKVFSARFQGVSNPFAAALFSDGADAGALYHTMSRLAAGEVSPCHTGAAVLPFHPAGMAFTAHDTLSGAMDAFYEQRDIQLRIGRQASSLRATLEHARKRVEKRLSACAATLLDEQSLAKYRLYGELLTASASRVPRGSDRAVVENYYEETAPSVEIPLDPTLSAMDNAQRYFKKYRKGRTAQSYAAAQQETLGSELLYLEGQLENLGNCQTVNELWEIREELTGLGYLKRDKAGKKTAARPQPSTPLLFLAPDGTRVEVGKNNLQNDRLTKAAPPEAVWLHAKDMAGSHVVVYTDTPSQQTLLFAAGLAAYYSKGRASDNVPVDYTKRKFVKKPAGAKPGFVIYQNQRTLYVRPDNGGME